MSKDNNNNSTYEFKNCRFFRDELPEVEDLVIVKVKNIEDFGAFVSLPEYNNIEGMILSSEVSRKRIRSIHKHLRIGKHDVMQVLRVDTEKGYIDLSKKYVSEEEQKQCYDSYTKSKNVHSIMKHVAITCKMPLEELLEKVAWVFYDQFDHAMIGLSKILKDEELLNSLDVDDHVKKALIKEVSHRLEEQPFKCQAVVEVTCFTEEGIDAIRPALLAGKDVGENTDATIAINLVSTPLYRLSLSCINEQQGISLLNESIEKIREVITERKGRLVVKEEPNAQM
eukprot:TRINITY_DN320_c0_g1_i1.p2 TRINITY_DN320_c0_g1~~TRINITY_DN320_c0_g1_i1.p2  ORF type:complete len:283 (-),score=106.08 TRINITY_DN320_c0_g1_i1:1434-2282(-)